MEIVLKSKEIDSLIDDVMANFPEASSPSLRCIDFDYEGCEFEFWDSEVTPTTAEKSLVTPTVEKKLELRLSVHEDAVCYRLSREDLRRGMKTLLGLFSEGRLRGISQYVLRNVKDAGNWDADASDALVQCAIFGDVIYG